MKEQRKMEVSLPFEGLRTFIEELPERFDSEGSVIYKGRNELRLCEAGGYQVVVKSYRLPNVINRFVYGFLRPSKAERSYRYGLMLIDKGFGTPMPVGFTTCRRGISFRQSYSVTLLSDCPYTWRDFATRSISRHREIAEAVALFTARLHDAGILHKDYSAGNIFFDNRPEYIPVEIIDLNRIVFKKKIGMMEGCKNFERLPCSDDMLRVMAYVYAQARGFDPEECLAIMRKYINIEIKKRSRKQTAQ